MWHQMSDEVCGVLVAFLFEVFPTICLRKVLFYFAGHFGGFFVLL